VRDEGGSSTQSNHRFNNWYHSQQFPAHGTAWTQTRRRGNLGKPTENEVESLSHRFCDIRSPAVGRRRCLRRPSRRNPIFTAYLRRPGIAGDEQIPVFRAGYRNRLFACPTACPSGVDSAQKRIAEANFATAIQMIASLPLSDAEKAEAVRRLLDRSKRVTAEVIAGERV
jgi:hypothetical protein